jgi:hypothetical protein
MRPLNQVDPQTARILEIGDGSIMKAAFPNRTRLLWTYNRLAEPESTYESFSLTAAWQIWRELRAGQIDLIVVWSSPYAPWNYRRLRAVFTRPFRPWKSLVRIFGVQALRFPCDYPPILAIDSGDSRTIERHNHFLLDKAKFFFKRELPVDRWQVFHHTAHPAMPGARFRSNPRNRQRVEKLRPISLGANPLAPAPDQLPFPEKTTDLFVALTTDGGSTVRSQGIEQIHALAARGIVLDVAEGPLSFVEYTERMTRAWLTWSPEGLGWDCFRHYEAPLVHTVPVINSPTIVRYEPMLDGIHAVYYEPDDPTSLGDRIVAALADKGRLRQIAEDARSHVLKFHARPQPLADRLLRIGLGLEEPPSGTTLRPVPKLGHWRPARMAE